MNKLNTIQKIIRIVGIVCGVIPLGLFLVIIFPPLAPLAVLFSFGRWRWVFLLPVALTLMLVDIGIAIYKRFAKQVSIKAYDYGKADGIAEERARVSDWVITNRRAIELSDDVVMYRDSFSSEDLIDFIDSGDEIQKDL